MHACGKKIGFFWSFDGSVKEPGAHVFGAHLSSSALVVAGVVASIRRTKGLRSRACFM